MPFPGQDVVVVLGEAVGFVADVLQQPQRVGVAAQPVRFRFARQKHLFLALRQRQREGRRDAQTAQAFHGRAELAFAAVNQQEVREGVAVILQPF